MSALSLLRRSLVAFSIVLWAAWIGLEHWDLAGWLLVPPLEHRFEALPPPPGTAIAGIIALGGEFQRVVTGAELARNHPDATFVISGAGEEAAHAYALGLPHLASRLVFETASRTTHENAVYTAALLKPAPSGTWILVTSAAHMPRAAGAFRRAGMTIHAWPVSLSWSRSDRC